MTRHEQRISRVHEGMLLSSWPCTFCKWAEMSTSAELLDSEKNILKYTPNNIYKENILWLYDYMYIFTFNTHIYIFTLYIHTYLDHIHICIYNYICTVLTAHYCKWCNDSGASSFHNPCCPESTTTKMMDDVKAPTVAKTATPVGGFLVVYFAARKQTCHATRLSLEWNEWSSSPGIFYQWTASSCINVCRQ